MKLCKFSILVLVILVNSLFARDQMILDERFNIDNKLDINIKIDAGEVEVKKNLNDNECHVWIEYDHEYAEADIRFNEKRNTLDILVDFESWKSIRNNDHKNNQSPDILIELPGNVELEIKANLKAGEFNLELGDLSIRNFEFTNWAGEANISFDKPNHIEMESLDVNFKVGELNIKKLGNAKFSEADINSGIGELTIDFSGEMLERSMARVDLDIGETDITIPEEIGAKLRVSKFLFLSEINYPKWFDKKGKYYYSKNYNDIDKNLYLLISTGIGELSIRVK